MVYVIQSIGELCLSPIGLSMVTKLAPVLVGGMGGWFLSTAIGNNLSGIFASHVSGEGGMAWSRPCQPTPSASGCCSAPACSSS